MTETQIDAPDPWRALVETLTPRLHAWVTLRIGTKMRARVQVEDITQAIWTRVLEKFDLSENAAPPDAPAVFRLARYVLLEEIRRVQRLGSIQFSEGRTTRMQDLNQRVGMVTTLTRRLARDEGIAEFQKVLDGLPEIEQKLVRLVGLEQRTQADAAKEIGLSHEALAKRWQRLLAKLQQSGAPPGLLD